MSDRTRLEEGARLGAREGKSYSKLQILMYSSRKLGCPDESGLTVLFHISSGFKSVLPLLYLHYKHSILRARLPATNQERKKYHSSAVP